MRAPRGAAIVRMWRVLVLIRQKPRRLAELAEMLRVSERQIRRDLEALQAVPFPIQSRFPTGQAATRKNVRADLVNEWYCGDTPAWPTREPAPIADLSSSLAPFPKGPLVPPGVFR
jgi:hypothetical protein